ncbi:MAG: NAD-dependent protein deacylase [bacterium]|nr:NAD-dependent protein deacylase [bacterium]
MTGDEQSTTLSAVARLLSAAERALFITGAGLSADSGLPTYRGIGGLYADADTDEGMPIEEALSGPMLATRPELTWKYLWQIGSAVAGGRFNRGHEVMAEIERARPETWVVTQNVDGFHLDAGSKNVVEIHGNAGELECTACRERSTAQELLAGYEGEVPLPPRCATCDGLIRPRVVLFGEMLPDEAVARLGIALERRDLVLVVGTSALFPYISGPVMSARACGIPTVEINPARTELSDLVEHRLPMRAAEALERIWSPGA